MIDDGESTIHDAAGIIEADGQQSSHAIETCSGEASEHGKAGDPRPWSSPVGCTTPRIDAFPSPASGASKGSPVRFPSPESNSDHAENGGNATAPNKESNRDQDVATVKPVQIPFTRSSDFRGLASGSAEPSDVIPVAIPTSPAAEARLAALSLHLVSPASVDFPEVIENLGGA